MADTAQPIDAASTDPAALAVMKGFPPPAERTVKLADTTSWRFPNTRWSFSHQRELARLPPSAGGRPPPRPCPTPCATTSTPWPSPPRTAKR